MKREGEIRQMLRECFGKFTEELRGRTVVLFGSRAEGTAQPRSDFDIGIIGPQTLPLKTFYKIEDMLDNIDTLYTLDWVDLNSVGEEFRAEALSHTEVIYEG